METIANRFEKVQKTRSYETIVDQIRQLVDSGKLNPGDRLPPERDLAETLFVSRATLKEAFRVLEHIGLVESKMGQGRFIAELRVARPESAPPSEALEYATVVDFLQVRRFLEVPMTGVAAELATDNDIARIEEALRLPDEDDKAWLHSDTEFHLAVAAASHNSVYARFVSSEEFLLYRMATTAALSPSIHAQLRDEHREVGEAIRRHDRLDAEAAMLRHITTVTRVLRLLLDQHGARGRISLGRT